MSALSWLLGKGGDSINWFQNTFELNQMVQQGHFENLRSVRNVVDLCGFFLILEIITTATATKRVSCVDECAICCLIWWMQKVSLFDIS